MRRIGIRLFVAEGLLAITASSCQLKESPTTLPGIRLETVVKGLMDPLGLVHAGDGTERLFIVAQRGTILIWEKGTWLDRPFLDIRDRVTSG
jgi:hypothetical protein